jgi:hypothetical protein
MPGLGERLRERRRRQGLELAQLESRLNVSPKYLRALEWERFDLLPNEETAKRAVRAYAEFLQLDVEPCVQELAERLAPAGQAPEERCRTRTPRRTLLASLVPAIPAGVLVPLVLALQQPHHGSSRPEHPAAARASLVRPLAPRTHATPPAPTASARPARLDVVAARGASWLVVRSGSARGPVLFAGILARGRSVHFRKPGLWLQLGAASNVELRANGARPSRRLFGTLDAVVTRSGFCQVPLAAGKG